MSLKLLTNKLKRQSLAESGTPVELQTSTEQEMESDDDDFNANKGLVNCLPSSPSRPTCHPNIPHCTTVDFCNDNYSSEEELKEIIYSDRHRKRTGGRKSSTPQRALPSASSLKTPTSPNLGNGFHPAEKRKWSEVSGCNLCTYEGNKSGLCLCDKNDNFDGGNIHDIFGNGISSTPVQFCTSPPIDVHKPRHHSSSPPAKVFHLSQSFEEKAHTGFRPHQFMAAFKPSVGILEVNVAGHRLFGPTQFDEDDHDHPNSSNSPNKRPRSTPGPQQMQRPCLDFEKMQQIHTKVVTSWRPQGTELSIFCW